MEVTEIDAARRQLETAVVLYFREEDPVSIHTLACAAYEILLSLNRASNGAPTWNRHRSVLSCTSSTSDT